MSYRFSAKLWVESDACIEVCVCPDYVLVPRSHQEQLANALSVIYKEFYPEGPSKSDSFGRLVNTTSANRLNGYLQNTKGKVLLGGDSDGCYLAPTVVTDVTGDDAMMQEEMFGPVLSIVPIDNLDEAIEFINNRCVGCRLSELLFSFLSRPQPLALYVFTQDAKFKEKSQSRYLVSNQYS